MADDTFGQWATLSFGVPDFMVDVRDAINEFAELLTALLEIVNQALEFAQAFVKAYLDPMAALIEAIIAEVVALLRSLRGIGLYLTGDWALLGWPPEDLRGGYQAYERRMVARLTDRTDPTRPDVPSTTQVFGVFAYLSVDPSDVERLIDFIRTLGQMFGASFHPETSQFPVPVIRDVRYGPQALVASTAFQFAPLGKALTTWNGTPPQQCRVSWVAQSASPKSPMNPFPQLGPSGYLVTVSTIADGIALKYARPRSNTDTKAADGVQAAQVQPREYGVVRDLTGQPIVLHGGAEMLVFHNSGFEFNKGLDGTPVRLKDGYCQVYGMVGNEIIPLEDLGPYTGTLGTPGDGKGADYLLQRTFLITDGVTMAQWASGEYGAIFNLEDMPKHATWIHGPGGTITQAAAASQPSTYYVRVWSVGKQVAAGGAVPKWDFSRVAFNAATAGQPFAVNLQSGATSVGLPSQSRRVTFVGADTQEYLKALQTALLFLVLSRADLPTLAEITAAKGETTAQQYLDGVWAAQGFAKTATGLEDARRLLSRLYPDPKVLEIPGQEPGAWRADLYARIQSLALDIYAKTGTNARLEAYVVANTAMLRSTTVGDYLSMVNLEATWQAALAQAGITDDVPLWESLNPDGPVAQRITGFGLAPNIWSMGVPAAVVDGFFFEPAVLQGRESAFVMYDGGTQDVTFEETDPVAVRALIAAAPEGLREIYTKFVQADGSLKVPDDYQQALTVRAQQVRLASSGDATPVFMVDREDLLKVTRGAGTVGALVTANAAATAKDPEYIPSLMTPGVVYTRGVIQEARTTTPGDAYTQAALVLRLACADRAPADGEWLALRLFDTWPALEEFLRSIETWVKSLAAATQSIADAILGYIRFIQAQIVELQQLIRRIDSLLESFLAFSFALPQFSGLMLLSNGTDGVLADFMAATNKPSDSPLSYGGGLALLAPFAPEFLRDIFSVVAGEEGQPTQDLDGSTTTTRPPPAIGTEALAPIPRPTPDPDVL